MNPSWDRAAALAELKSAVSKGEWTENPPGQAPGVACPGLRELSVRGSGPRLVAAQMVDAMDMPST